MGDSLLTINYFLLALGLLLLLGVGASKISSRLGVPSLLLFLFLGMLAGSEGIGGIYFDNPYLAQLLGTLALVFILHSGGLSTRFTEIRPVLWEALSLSTLGVLLTAGAVTALAFYVLGFPLLLAALLGATISSTDAAAVFNVLRAKNLRLKGTLGPLLELESGANDPMAVFLTVAIDRLIANSHFSLTKMVLMFFNQMGLGALVGLGMGWLLIYILKKIKLEHLGLYHVLSMGWALLTYVVASFAGGSGFLAVYLTGILVGNKTEVYHRELLQFHDGLAWLMQIMMFLTLGLLVFPSRLLPVFWMGLEISVFLIFVARPAAVWLSLLFSRRKPGEKFLVSWVGLKGAVPIILATFPYLAGIRQADLIFNLVFFIVLISTLFQGSTIALVARWLKLEG